MELDFAGDEDACVRVNLRLRPQAVAVWGHLSELQRALPGTVRIVVLRGLTDLAPCPDVVAFQQACDWTDRPAFISIAVLDSHTVGPAFDLAMGCDLRIVTAEALLAAPTLVSTGRLAGVLGYAAALELIGTGRPMLGNEAFQRGVAQRQAPAVALEEELERLVAQLLAPNRDDVRELKALLLGAGSRSPAEQRVAEREALLRRESSQDAGAPGD
ncbi:enoyl-CoA hydratase/isomerase family protein [Acidothermaceae bacterium B102]|nr:enoyl-CoA hydratase/isomerase family protein [Acidothermaceae bacterium B102]